ncbi:MAG: MBOAT family protein [Clostridia bacterium]|nr:MBOAT family protein [Clostridia bacterium]
MLFNSLQFVLFFPIVVILYFLVPHKYRWALLLVASYVFYMGWNAAYALLLLTSTVVTYGASLLMAAPKLQRYKKLFLVLSIVINLGILFTFKYFNFFFSGLYAVLDALHIAYTEIPYSLVLPVGISFYTFQALGYSIDVYRGDVPVQKHFGKYALFVSFFPQLVAGPIERSKNLLPQFDEVHRFNYENAAAGLRLMAWGYFKKIVIADTVCVAVNTVYNHVEAYDGVALIAATLLFTIQIFCDFSGYSDIARGCARIMGFRLMKNFDHPYFATSIKDFWRRWHISLSTWFKDYVYIPLGGNRKGEARTCLNLMITFLVSGLWHGANWTFVIWGGLHGLLQVIGRITKRPREACCRAVRLDKVPRVHGVIQMLITFCFVAFGWIFFRANSLHDAGYVITHLFAVDSLSFSSVFSVLKMMFGTRAEVYRLLLTLPVFVIASVLDYKVSLSRLITRRPAAVRYILYLLIILYMALMARSDMQDFIYFQF